MSVRPKLWTHDRGGTGVEKKECSFVILLHFSTVEREIKKQHQPESVRKRSRNS